MNIAIINFTYGKKTGIENVADNIVRQLDKIDQTNRYFFFINNHVKNYYEGYSRIQKKVVKLATRRIVKTIWLLCVYPFYALIKGIDITIIFNCSSNFALSPFTKNIVYVHDLGELIIENKYDSARMIYRKYVSLPVNRLFGDIFIVVSKFTQRNVIEKLKIDEKKVKLIYNGTDDRIKKVDKGYARKRIIEKYGINDSAKILITTGRIDPVGKNLLKLIEAADIIGKSGRDFHLFLIGESHFPNAHLVPAEIQKRRLTGFITLPGYIETDELNLFYNAADALVFPSIYEGFGLPLLEAMKCDLPVTCSDIEVFHEVADDAALYFDPNDAQDMANCITVVLSNPDIRNRLIKKGNERRSLFSWHNSAKQLLDTIKGMASLLFAAFINYFFIGLF
jgi:glycosyltransferase involved in cell wall biosynthesis